MKVDEFGQEQELELENTKVEKNITSEVFAGYGELFFKTATRSALARGALETLSSLRPSVGEIINSPADLPSKVEALKFKVPTDRYFLFYTADNKCFGLVPNRDHSIKMQSLKQRIS